MAAMRSCRSPGLHCSSIQANTQPDSSAKLFIDTFTIWWNTTNWIHCNKFFICVFFTWELNDWNKESMSIWKTWKKKQNSKCSQVIYFEPWPNHNHIFSFLFTRSLLLKVSLIRKQCGRFGTRIRTGSVAVAGAWAGAAKMWTPEGGGSATLLVTGALWLSLLVPGTIWFSGTGLYWYYSTIFSVASPGTLSHLVPDPLGPVAPSGVPSVYDLLCCLTWNFVTSGTRSSGTCSALWCSFRLLSSLLPHLELCHVWDQIFWDL